MLKTILFSYEVVSFFFQNGVSHFYLLMEHTQGTFKNKISHPFFEVLGKSDVLIVLKFRGAKSWFNVLASEVWIKVNKPKSFFVTLYLDIRS